MPERLSVSEPRTAAPWWPKPLAGAVLLVTALISLTMNNDGLERFVGSGVIGCEPRLLPEFHGIDACGSIDVQISQGPKFEVKVEGEENLLSYVTTEVRSGVLCVGTRRGRFTATSPLVVKVSAPDLRSLEVSGSGSLLGQTPLASKEMALRVTGSGELTVSGKFESVRAELPGSGDLTVGGETRDLAIDLEGSGTLQAQALRASEACQVELSGSGDCFVWADGPLRVLIDGSGSVRYRGETEHVSSEIEGSGNLGVLEEGSLVALTLHYHPLASFCWKVVLALYENEIPFTPRLVDLGSEQERSSFADLWPIAKMPVLVDGERAVPETSIILEYLDLHHPGPHRWVPEDPEQALQARLLDRFYDLYVQTPMQKIVGDRLRPKDQKDAFGVAEARTTLATACGMVERDMVAPERYKNGWAIGETFSMADCAAAPALFYADKVMPLADDYPHTLAYLRRLEARPSMARVLREAEPFFKNFPQE